VLVERGYSYSLHHNPYNTKVTFKINDMKDAMALLAEGYKPTIAAAITSAVCELIENEKRSKAALIEKENK
jgi:hypothetical protein